jgi:membrane-bound lytic murein transglycosylase D
VPQIVAAIQIGREPHRFGFEPIQPSPPAMDRVAVPAETELRWLSASTGIPVEALQSLNPALVRGVTPPGGHFELNVPEGASSQVLAAVQRAAVAVTFPGSGTARAERWSEASIVRPRDTVQSIARRYGVSVETSCAGTILSRRMPSAGRDRPRITTIPGGR